MGFFVGGSSGHILLTCMCHCEFRPGGTRQSHKIIIHWVEEGVILQRLLRHSSSQ